MEQKRIVMIVGSFRKQSFNRQAAREAERLIGDRAAVSFLEYEALPFMNQDIEFPVPKEVKRIRDEIRRADGIWIFTPEYNHSIPGGLKNLLDWLSRAEEKGGKAVIRDIPVTISSAAGSSGGTFAQEALRSSMALYCTKIMEEPRLTVSIDRISFGDDQLRLKEEELAVLREQTEAFLRYIDL